MDQALDDSVPAGRPGPAQSPWGSLTIPAESGSPLQPPADTAVGERSTAGGAAARRPALVRDRENGWLSGVAAGIANHLGWPVAVVRLGFVLLAMANFVGIAVYGFLWVMIPTQGKSVEAPGLAAARRADMRRPGPATQRTRSRDVGSLAAVLVLGLSVVWLVQATGLGVRASVFVPMALAMFGVGLVWRQADTSEQPPPNAPSSVPGWAQPLISQSKWPSIVRILLGVGLLGTGITMVAASTIGLSQLPAVLVIALLMLGSVLLLVAPWIHNARLSMVKAREEKLLLDAHADMAAHLHDSVLQTLALIQRQADDPRTVASLARRQERELRTWLYGATPQDETVRSALVRAGGEIEDERGVAIEVVCVGDTPLTPDFEALIMSAREAMLNAAKHSGADTIDVYAEVSDHHVEIFVRDRGQGFDMDTIGEDRMGVRRSIIDRMQRHGGKTTIRSAPGEGTEVRLEMNR